MNDITNTSLRRGLAGAALALAAGLAPSPAGAQVEPEGYGVEPAVRSQYAAVDSSVVRVRTIATLEQEVTDPATGELVKVKRPLSVYGTGVVVGEEYVDGRWEYLVVTNHHVADVSNYLISDGRFLRENKHNTRAVPTVPEEVLRGGGGARRGRRGRHPARWRSPGTRGGT